MCFDRFATDALRGWLFMHQRHSNKCILRPVGLLAKEISVAFDRESVVAADAPFLLNFVILNNGMASV